MKTFRTLLALATAAFSGAASAQSFDVYVSIGDSLAAGFTNGALVENHQRVSVPALIARQAGAPNFEQPLVGAPGIPAELGLVSLVPVVIAPVSATPGQPQNLSLPRPYNNLAVPGATLLDALTKTTDGGGMHDLVLRGLGSQVDQAKALHPTFITVWIGNNDVLGAALRGRAVAGETLTQTQAFRQDFARLLVELRSTGATVVAANLPNVTAIPFVSTIPPVVLNPQTREPVVVEGHTVPLLGPAGPLPSNAKVTLAATPYLAQGVGIPAILGGTGTPLPNEVVLDPGEISTIQDHVNTNNAAIRELCAAADVPLLDIYGLFTELSEVGREIGGIRVTSDFLTGGLFGYDGVHPSELGYALVANEWIATINASGGSLPLVDLGPYLVGTAASRRARAPMEFTDAAWRNLLQAFPPLD
jgi:lysophospholipase L1-like esterase